MSGREFGRKGDNQPGIPADVHEWLHDNSNDDLSLVQLLLLSRKVVVDDPDDDGPGSFALG